MRAAQKREGEKKVEGKGDGERKEKIKGEWLGRGQLCTFKTINLYRRWYIFSCIELHI